MKRSGFLKTTVLAPLAAFFGLNTRARTAEITTAYPVSGPLHDGVILGHRGMIVGDTFTAEGLPPGKTFGLCIGHNVQGAAMGKLLP